MDSQIVDWMRRYGFWPTWALATLGVVLFSAGASTGMMLLLSGDVSRQGILIGVLIPFSSA